MTALDAFLDAYRACALWSSTDEHGEPLDAAFSVDDITGGSWLRMRDDCAAFLDAHRDDLAQSGLSAEQAGHDFWLTRNGHGAGFWDRGLGDVGRRLTDAAKVYGSSDLYEGADGFLYLS